MSPPDATRTSPPVEASADRTRSVPDVATHSAGDPVATAAGPVLAAFGEVPEIPGFEIFEEVGRGGMGVVFKARHVKLNRTVALKMILSADARSTIRFLAEAEAAAAVRHPHVVQVFDFGEVGGRPFLAMEFLDGGDLSDRLKANTSYSPSDAATLVGQVARGVAAAHALGIVHRDIKPGNVLFDAAGTPKVVDFGLAKRGGSSDLTATHAMMGTPSYMSPEQAKGAKFAGPPADVWALGVILYECLTGTRPFDGDDVHVIINRVLNDEPQPLRKRNAAVPRDLELIALKCLAKEPQERYATASELADELDRFTRGEPVLVRPAGVVERTYKWAKRKPAVAALYAAAVAAVLLIGVTVAIGRLWLQAEREREWSEQARGALAIEKRVAVSAQREAEEARAGVEQALGKLSEEQEKTAKARDEATKARDAANTARDDENRAREQVVRHEYARSLDLVTHLLKSGDIPRARELLNSSRPDLRGWEWQLLKRSSERDALKIETQGSARGLISSPDGRYLYGSTSIDFGPPSVRDLSVWNLGTGERERVIPSAAGPSGKYIADASMRRSVYVVPRNGEWTIVVTNLETGEEIAVLPRPGQVKLELKPDDEDLALSPDGRQVAVVHRDRTLVRDTARLWDIDSGKELFDPAAFPDRVQSIAFTARGSRVVSLQKQTQLSIHDATGKVVSTCPVLDGPNSNGINVNTVRLSPDGSHAVLYMPGLTMRLINVVSGQSLFEINGTVNCEFSADGRYWAAVGKPRNANQPQRVWLWDTLSQRAFSSEGSTQFRFSPDGRRIATWDSPTNAVHVMDTSSGVRLATIPIPTQAASPVSLAAQFEVAFTPDGRRLICTTLEREPAGEKGKNKNTHLIHVFDIDAVDDVITYPAPQLANSVQAFWTAEGFRTVSITGKQTVVVWNPETKKSTTITTEGRIYGAGLSPDGRTLATALVNGLQMWSLEGNTTQSPAILGKCEVEEQVRVFTLPKFSADGQYLAAVGWEFTPGKEVTGHPYRLFVWDAKTSREISRLAISPERTTGDPRNGSPWGSSIFVPRQLEFTANGKRLMLAGGNEHMMWAVDTWIPLPKSNWGTVEDSSAGTFGQKGFYNDGHAVLPVLSPDRKTLIVRQATVRESGYTPDGPPTGFGQPGGGGPGGGPRPADPEQMWTLLVKLSGGIDTIRWDQISPESRVVLRGRIEIPPFPDTGEWTKDQFSDHWTAHQAKIAKEFVGPPERKDRPFKNPNPATKSTSTPPVGMKYDDDGNPVVGTKPKSSNYFSGNSKPAAGSTSPVASSKPRLLPELDKLTVRDITGNPNTLAVPFPKNCTDPRFSPDGTRIFGMGFDDRIHLWDAKTMQEVYTIPTPAVLAWCLSADGQQLLIASADGVRILDVTPTAQRVVPLAPVGVAPPPRLVR